MDSRSTRWISVTPSQYDWEREALDYLRAALPDREPFRVWSNFEFIAEDGSINEVDALVLTSHGLFMLEIKSWRGAVRGTGTSWYKRFEGREYAVDNPRILTDRKAKRLKALLLRQGRLPSKDSLGYLEAAVFLSATDLNTNGLDHTAAQWVFVRERSAQPAPTPLPGLRPLFDWHPRGKTVTAPLARWLSRAMKEIGIGRSQTQRRVGDYILGELLEDEDQWQDYAARHASLDGVETRVRLYHTAAARGTESRQTLQRAAQREVLLLQGIDHPGIVSALGYSETEQGPAVVLQAYRGAKRLDLWLQERDAELTFDQRFHLLRELCEILQFAHGRRLTHRTLNPRAVLVLKPNATYPRLAVRNWHAGSRGEGTTTDGRPSSLREDLRATIHPDRLVVEESRLYLAPEALLHEDIDGIRADVFSLGAIAYRLFTKQAPAADEMALRQRLLEYEGLDLSAAVDGVSAELEELVASATHPRPDERTADTSTLLAQLEELEDQATAPPEAEFDPERAGKGDVLPDGSEILRRLGHGSTSIVFLARRGERNEVLKVARDIQKNEFLSDEAGVLRQLRHHNIVELFESTQIGDRKALWMAQAGNETLAQNLREKRRPGLELLERWGDELLGIVLWLEEHGISHRDIKPSNIGIRGTSKKTALHLVLFDFSLARVAADRIDVGTPPYLDPFLRSSGRGRWDLAAERFATAMTLYEMATGRLPTWGSGDEDPLYCPHEANLFIEAFEPALRAPLEAFFAKALARDAAQRFDNAEQMQRAWKYAFAEAHRPSPPADQARATDALDNATLETKIHQLGLSPRVVEALERLEVDTVSKLLATSSGRIQLQSRIGGETRRELLQAQKHLRDRLGTEPPPTTDHSEAPSIETPGTEAAKKRTAAKKRASAKHRDGKKSPPSEEAEHSTDGTQSPAAISPPPQALDRIAELLISRTAKGNQVRTLELLLGFESPSASEPATANSAQELRVQPNQKDIADQLGVTSARISQILTTARKRWLKLPALTSVREDILSLLQLRGGVLPEDELARALLAGRGAASYGDVDPEKRQPQALAVTRAANAAEQQRAQSRWVVRRTDAGSLYATANDQEGLSEDERTARANALAAWAQRLGKEADELAGLEPLAAPRQVLERLTAIQPPAGVPAFAGSSLLTLAAAASRRAALSSRGEIYPVGLPAQRALELASGVLLSAHELTEKVLRDRVRSRYPEAQPLPDRPELDQLLQKAKLDLTWYPAAHGGKGAFGPPSSTGTSWSTSRTRSGTAVPGRLARRFTSEEELAVEAFESRLQRGGWLVLRTPPRDARRALEALTDHYPVVHRSGDRLLLHALRRAAEEHRIPDWSVVLRADAADPHSTDGRNLRSLVEAALPRVEAELLQTTGTVLLTEPGLLGRYDHLNLLERLRDRLALPDPERKLGGLWILIPSDDQSDAPKIYGRVLGLVSPASECLPIPTAWLRRARRRTATSDANPA